MAAKTKRELGKIAREITFDRKNRVSSFLELNHAERARLLFLVSTKIQKDVVNSIDDDELVGTLEHLDPVDATHTIQFLPKGRSKKIIEKLSAVLRQNIEILLQFDPKTAAGVMNLNYVQADEKDTLEATATKLKEYEEQTGRMPVVIVLREGKVAGYMPTYQFGFGRPSDKVGDFVKRIPKVFHGKNRKEVLEVFRKNRHDKVVVVGEEQNVLGIIYSDDIIRLLREEESASLYEFAGVREEEDVGDPTMEKVKFRYKWLVINLGTSFLAASVVGLFEGTISKYVLLAVYMPIVAGMGGNAATQTLAVLVRGIALKQIRIRTAWPTLKRELGAGLVNGLINGILVAGVVILINRDFMIAIVLSLAMVVNLFVAALFGTMVPLIMKRLGKDPAASATIFITTATDVLGFLAFLGLAAILLS